MSTVDIGLKDMADLSITAANVKPGAAANPIRGVASGAITAGQVVAVAADGTIVLADSNGTPPINTPAGIAACTASGAGQFILYVALDADFTIGASVVSGTGYFLSGNPGGICLQADLTSGMTSSLIGIGKGTTKLWVDIVPSGQVV